MYKKKLRSYLILTIVGVFLTSLSCQKDAKEHISVTASGNEGVPDWLKIRVHNALPDTGFNLWVPGGTFRQSSLVRVPRFPEKIDPQETQEVELEGVRIVGSFSKL